MFYNPTSTTGGATANLTSDRVFRKSDETTLNSGDIINPDFITFMTGTKLTTLRGMLNILNSGNESILVNPNYALRTPKTAISYVSRRFPTSLISVGNVTLSGTAFTGGSYPGMPANWTDKEVFQGNFQSAGLNTTVTAVSAGASNGASGNYIRLTMADTSALSTGQVVNYQGYTSTSGTMTGYGLSKIRVISATQIDLETQYPGGAVTAFVTFSGSPGILSTMTINIGSGRTPKLLIGPGGFTLPNFFSTNPVTTNVGTMMYDAQLDAVMYTSGGLYAGLNPDWLVDIANRLNVNVYINVPSTVSDASVTAIGAMAKTNLNSGSSAFLEYTNEPWNSAFFQAFYLNLKGNAVGVPGNFISGNYSWVGLRQAQIMQLYEAAWSPRSQTQLNGVFNIQFAAGVQSSWSNFTFKGSQLDPTSNAVLCAYLGGTFSGTCSGATNYSLQANWPANHIRYAAYAPYAGVNYASSGIAALAQTYQTNPTSALASMQTQMMASYTGNAAYSATETALAGFDGMRPVGYGPILVECYEGGTDLMSATVGNYTSLGLTTSGTVTFNLGSSPAINQTGHPYINGSKVSFSGGVFPAGLQTAAVQSYFVINAAANAYDVASTYYNPVAAVLSGSPSGTTTATGSTTSIDNLFEGWKNSSYPVTWTAGYNANFKSFSHNQTLGFLLAVGNNWNLSSANSSTTSAANRWSFMQGNIYSSSYQMLPGIQQLNFLLKRDLDPASNDNDPMWLEKAA